MQSPRMTYCKRGLPRLYSLRLDLNILQLSLEAPLQSGHSSFGIGFLAVVAAVGLAGQVAGIGLRIPLVAEKQVVGTRELQGE